MLLFKLQRVKCKFNKIKIKMSQVAFIIPNKLINRLPTLDTRGRPPLERDAEKKVSVREREGDRERVAESARRNVQAGSVLGHVKLIKYFFISLITQWSSQWPLQNERILKFPKARILSACSITDIKFILEFSCYSF